MRKVPTKGATMRFAAIALLCFGALTSSVAAQEAPVQPVAEVAPTYQTYSEAMPFQHIFEPRDGEIRMQLGRLRSGETFLSIPVAHRQTFVTSEDATFEGFSVPAGTQGYAGEHAPVVTYLTSYPNEIVTEYRASVMCFVLDATDAENGTRCITPYGVVRGRYGLFGGIYFVDLPAPAPKPPAIEMRDFAFAEDLRVEYAMRPWTRSRARVAIKVNGESAGTWDEQWNSRGVATFRMAVGVLRVEQDGNNPQHVTVSLRPYEPRELAELARDEPVFVRN